MPRDAGIASSMSGRGNCFDNSMVEAVFKTLKAELVWRTVFLSELCGKLGDGQPVRRRSVLASP
jgi:putative transposase